VDTERIATWESDDPRVEDIWSLCGETAALLGYARNRPESAK